MEGITIIGAGNVGAALTRLLTAAGHRVTVANSRGPQSLSDLAAQTGATARTVAEAVEDAEVLVLAVPFGAIPDLAGALAKLPQQTVVVDAGNYVPALRDAPIGELDDGGTESAWTARQLGRPVIKAFNTAGRRRGPHRAPRRRGRPGGHRPRPRPRRRGRLRPRGRRHPRELLAPAARHSGLHRRP
jgi:predicted dinucleotide-binding enzyme